MRLAGKTAIVTGGASGIGRAIALRFGEEGAKVLVADLKQAACEKVVEEIVAAGGVAVPFAVDVTDKAQCEAMVAAEVEAFGELNILVNAAGVFRAGHTFDMTEEDWDFVFDVNCKGLFFCSQAGIKQMVDQGKGGRVINLASQSVRRGEPHIDLYCASKFAVVSLTQSMALAFAENGITVNGIGPGIIETPMWEVVDAQIAKREGLPKGAAKKRAVDAIPLGRIGYPEDVAGCALFLASDDASYITRQVIQVDGGNWPA
ncbi:MAG: glucose 1-dehydrogenase [Thermomicrobiales bacterium]